MHFLFSIPEIVFEFSITVYTLAKGFRPSPILTGEPARTPVDERALSTA